MNIDSVLGQVMKIVFKTIENIMEQRENDGHQDFLIFPTMFKKKKEGFHTDLQKSGLWGKGLTRAVGEVTDFS